MSSIIDTLVTDRVEGATYNYTDLNRVEGAVEYLQTQYNTLPATLAAYLSGLGVAPDEIFEMPYTAPIPELTTKTDWARTDEPAYTEMARYIGNIATLRDVIPLKGTIPDTPADMDGLTYTEANAIEEILFAIDITAVSTANIRKGYADSTAEGFRKCGTFNCNQGAVILP